MRRVTHFQAHNQNVDQEQMQNAADHGQMGGHVFVVFGHQGNVGFAGQGGLIGRDRN